MCALRKLHNKNACKRKNARQQYKELLVPSRLYNLSEVQMRLKKYYKFMFVREPLERLVSAYRMFFVTFKKHWLAQEIQKRRQHRGKGNSENYVFNDNSISYREQAVS